MGRVSQNDEHFSHHQVRSTRTSATSASSRLQRPIGLRLARQCYLMKHGSGFLAFVSIYGGTFMAKVCDRTGTSLRDEAWKKAAEIVAECGVILDSIHKYRTRGLLHERERMCQV